MSQIMLATIFPNIRVSVFKVKVEVVFIDHLFSIQDKVSVLSVGQNIVDRHDAVRSRGTAGRKGIQFNFQLMKTSDQSETFAFKQTQPSKGA